MSTELTYTALRSLYDQPDNGRIALVLEGECLVMLTVDQALDHVIAGKAELLMTKSDILDMVSWTAGREPKPVQAAIKILLTK